MGADMAINNFGDYLCAILWNTLIREKVIISVMLIMIFKIIENVRRGNNE